MARSSIDRGNDAATKGRMSNRKYRAFLSYSHADRRIARWLHGALESYSLPKELRGTSGEYGELPPDLRPIFRDQDELPAVSALAPAILDALDRSDALVVIASPSSKASRWVNQEISEFIARGRKHRIHFVVVAGELPPGGTARDVLPPAFYDSPETPDPLFADLRPGKESRSDARTRVAAALLGIGYDQLRRRELQRRIRGFLLLSGVLAALLAIMVALVITATRARTAAVRSAERERRVSYDRLIQLADLKLEQNERGPAMQHLNDATESRGWEWGYLFQRAIPFDRLLKADSGRYECVAYSPREADLAAGTTAGDLQFWREQDLRQTPTGSPIRSVTIHAHQYGVLDVKFFPRGNYVLTAGADGYIRKWAVSVGSAEFECWHANPLHHDTTMVPRSFDQFVWTVAVDPRERWIIGGGGNGRLSLWDADRGKYRGGRALGRDQIRTVAFDSTGTLLAAGDDGGDLWLVEIPSLRVIQRRHISKYSVTWLAFVDARRTLVCTSAQGPVVWWSIVSGAELKQKRLIRSHELGSIRATTCLATRTLLTCSLSEKVVRAWDLDTGAPVGTLPGHETQGVGAVACSNDGATIATAGGIYDSTIRTWNRRALNPTVELRGHRNIVEKLAVAPSGDLIASAGGDETIRLWDYRTGDSVATLTWPEGGLISSVALDQDGRYVAAALNPIDDGYVGVWDDSTRALVRQLRLEGHYPSAVAFRPRRHELASVYTNIVLWNLDSGDTLMTFSGDPELGYDCVAFNADGRLVAAAGYPEIVVWSIDDRRKVFGVPMKHDSTAVALVFSPTRPWVAVARSGNVVDIWDYEAHRHVARLLGHDLDVTGVCFSDDGERLFSASEDRSVKIWDVETGLELLTLRGHRSGVSDVKMIPNTGVLVTSSADSTIRLW